MESLASYGTDEEQENDYYSSTMDGCNRVMFSSNSNQQRRDDDTNYDDVTMDMSEDSDQSTPEVGCQSTFSTQQSRNISSSYQRGGVNVTENSKHEGKKNTENVQEKVEYFRKSSLGDKSLTEDFKSSRNRFDRDKHDRYDTGKDKTEHQRQDRRDKDHRGHHRSDRDADRERGSRNDRERDKSERFDDKSRYERDRTSSRRDDSRDYDRDRKRRDDDRDRKRSRRRTLSRSHSKSRSRSRERSIRSEKMTKKKQLLEKLGIELQSPESMMSPQMLLHKSIQDQSQNKSGAIELPKYYNPGVLNPMKYADQMQKRKLLWSKKSETKPSDTGVAEVVKSPSTSTTGNVNKWGSARFAQDTDGKVASKFMRLMGIKDPAPKEAEATSSSDIIKKQEEMFSTMEQQYEVARTVTHTMRGMGLGFGSHGRQF